MTVEIENPNLLGAVCGPNDCNLEEISTLFSSPVRTRGNCIFIETQDAGSGQLFQNLLFRLSEIARRDDVVNSQQIQSVYAALESGNNVDELRIPFTRTPVCPRSFKQAEYIRSMSLKDLIFCTGPAGTGKTYLAVGHALMELLSKKKKKILLTRPVVETGESLGFLPGDLTQKLAPYLKPLYDSMETLIGQKMMNNLQETGRIELAPLAYMRGRNLKNCYIILDEAQNTTVEQMKMFLTRMGEGCRAVVTGDLSQVDLPRPEYSGLSVTIDLLKSLEEIAVCRLTVDDVVRHPLVKKIVNAYEKYS